MIYHCAIGDKFLHLSSDRIINPDEIPRCNDKNPHRCIYGKVDQGKQPERGSTLLSYQGTTFHPDDPTNFVQCERTVLFHNRICTSRHIDVGVLSLSHEVRTERQIIKYGTRDKAPKEDKPFNYCPCKSHTRDSLSLNLLQACRQIHEEAALVPYESNTFIFPSFQTFSAFFGLFDATVSGSNDHPIFVFARSSAIYRIRHIHLQNRFWMPDGSLFLTRLLRAGLSLLTGLHTFELTLGGVLYCWPTEWKINDSFFGFLRSVEKVVINIRDCSGRKWEHWYPTEAVPMRTVQDFAEKLIEQVLKKDGFWNETVLSRLRIETDDKAQ